MAHSQQHHRGVMHYGTSSSNTYLPNGGAMFSRSAEDAIYISMLAHINAGSLTWSRQTWESIFGKISKKHVFGETVFHGFDHFLHVDYLPGQRGHVTRFALEHWTPCFFTAPMNFSKAAAALPMSGTNPPCGAPYPAMIPRSMALRAREGPTEVLMICIHILIYRSRPWYVHSSWITFVI